MECTVDGTVKQDRYWRLPPFSEENQNGLDEAQTCEKIRELFDESVRIRMIADVPLGAFLSGGIDSSLVVASMALQSREPVKTFSIGFEEAAYNELKYAALVAKKYKTDHHEIVVRPDSLALIHKLVRHFDEPFADSQQFLRISFRSLPPATSRSRLAEMAATSSSPATPSWRGWRSISSLTACRGLLRRLMRLTANALPYSAYGKNFLHAIGSPTSLDRYFNQNYVPYFLRKQMLTPGVDAAGRRGLPAADAAG